MECHFKPIDIKIINRVIMNAENESVVIVTFRGKKVEIPLTKMTVGFVKSQVIDAAVTENASADLSLTSDHIKLMFKGKVLADDDAYLNDIFTSSGKQKTIYRVVAMGISPQETRGMELELARGQEKTKSLVRDDLSDQGRLKMKQRQQVGRQMMAKARNNTESSSTAYGFGSIETLPNLPQEQKVREILTALANDPGILACMKKHNWKVGSLAELYPEGKVGESEVCVMGLNRNKGQQILLRIRTDDLKGFRKHQSVRKVLYHELAHNVHSEHDGDFFQLMRQIEKECQDMDWTQGSGLSNTDTSEEVVPGGAFRLGGEQRSNNVTARELAARAAMTRLSGGEEEIEQNCGCGREHDLFLPPREES
jgi:hypothetical protein